MVANVQNDHDTKEGKVNVGTRGSPIKYRMKLFVYGQPPEKRHLDNLERVDEYPKGCKVGGPSREPT